MEPVLLSSSCSLDADEAFGPVVNSTCRNGFDFTLLFEQSMLGILPATAFLLVSPLRVRYLTKKDAYIRNNSMRLIKIVRKPKLDKTVFFYSQKIDYNLGFLCSSACTSCELGTSCSACWPYSRKSIGLMKWIID